MTVIRLLALSILALSLGATPIAIAQASDPAPPVLVGFDFSPRTIDVSSGPQNVTVTLHITDDLSGVLGALVSFSSPSGNQSAGIGINDPVDRISGTDHDGIYRAVIRVPQYAETGIWTISVFRIIDKAENYRDYTAADLAALGFPTQLTLTGLSDSVNPVLAGFDFSPRTIDVSSGPQNVTVTLHLTDDLSGVLGALVSFSSPSGNQSVGIGINDPVDRVSGTDHDGIYRAVIGVPQFAEAGTWTISVFRIIDKAENYRDYTAADLSALGFPGQLTVTGLSDSANPVLAGFDFSPRMIDVSNGQQNVMVTLHLTDDLSGVLGALVSFSSPSGNQSAGIGINDPVDRISGTDHDGIYQALIGVPQYAEAGTWSISVFRIIDKAENFRDYTAADLAALGFPTRLLVGPSPCDPTTSCDDGNVCTDDSCEILTGCVHTSNGLCESRPRSAGYYKKLCKHPHSGERLTQTDVECVSSACPFESVTTVAAICDVLKKDGPSDEHKCDKAASELMALTLNLCRMRVTDDQPIDSHCTDHATIGASRADAQAVLCASAPTRDACERAECESKEINSGKALKIDSLRVARLASGALRLVWEPPYLDPEESYPIRYRIWGRASSFDPFVLIGETPGLSYVDSRATGSIYEYEVTPVF